MFQISKLDLENPNVLEEQLIGKAVFRIPYIGWIKLIFFDAFNSEQSRGLCK